MFKGTRLPVAIVIENLEDLSVEELMEQFDVTREQVTAVLSSWHRAFAPTLFPPVLILLTTARRRDWSARWLGTRSTRHSPDAGRRSATARC